MDRIVDLAVAIPTSSLIAARRAVPLAARVGALGTARMIGRISEAVHQLRIDADDAEEPIDAAATIVAAADDVEPDGTMESESSPSVAADELPIEGYDDLAARQVVDRLADLDRADLARVEIYEREHRSRSTVLGKISMLTR